MKIAQLFGDVKMQESIIFAVFGFNFRLFVFMLIESKNFFLAVFLQVPEVGS